MVQLTLPKNSTSTPGKTWPKPAGDDRLPSGSPLSDARPGRLG
jgi:hypothetical protein